MSDESSGGGGCGCVMFILFILLFWAIWKGLPIGDKTWNIDIFPPRVWEMHEMPTGDVPVDVPATEPATSAEPSTSGSSQKTW